MSTAKRTRRVLNWGAFLLGGVLGCLALLVVTVALAWVFLHRTLEVGAMVAPRLYPGAVYRLPAREKVVALTMDDGPDAETTGALLDLLAENDARATHFLISSKVAGNEDLVRRILAEGHEIGHHMKTGQPSMELVPTGEFPSHFDEAAAVLEAYQEMRWFRPGSGLYSDEMIRYVEGKGYQCVLGTVHPADPQIHSTSFAERFIYNGVFPGAIIILHDGGGCGKRSIETLGRLLPRLRARGYRVVTLSELEGRF